MLGGKRLNRNGMLECEEAIRLGGISLVFSGFIASQLPSVLVLVFSGILAS